jgi:hypothetical protein
MEKSGMDMRRGTTGIGTLIEAIGVCKYLWLGLLFYPEDVGSISLQNVGKLLSDYAVSYPRRQ